MPAKKKLLQTKVDSKVFNKLHALSVAAGRTHANYLRGLIEAHVNSTSPGIVRAWRDVVPSSVLEEEAPTDE
jgi:hypothetical protein